MSTKINDFANTTLTKLVIAPQSLAATTTNATGADLLLGDGNCWMQANFGAFNGTVSIQVQQSTATDSGFADISGAVITATTAQSNGVSKINFVRDYRYCRVVATLSGTAVTVSAVLGEQLKQL